MYEVDFLFVGGSGMNATLSLEALEKAKELLAAGKPVTITAQNNLSMVFPQNLLMIQVGKRDVGR